MSRLPAAKKKRYDSNDAELLKKVSSEIITKETLSERLAQHVEQVSLVAFFPSSLQEQTDLHISLLVHSTISSTPFVSYLNSMVMQIVEV